MGSNACFEKKSMNENESTITSCTSMCDEKLLEEETSIASNEKDEDLLTEKVSSVINMEMSENLYETVLDEVLKDLVREELDLYKDSIDTVNEMLESTLNEVFLKIAEKERTYSAEKPFLDKFNKDVIDTVKTYLMNFYSQPSDKAQLAPREFKIQTRNQFMDLCKKFSNQFQEELKVSYYSIHECLLGIHLTPDSVMYIQDQINIYFDNLVSETREGLEFVPVVTIIHE